MCLDYLEHFSWKLEGESFSLLPAKTNEQNVLEIAGFASVV